ncbi:MAG: WbuC family cupin fold metalloprotein [Victivallaceae bacterium]|jgi:cupin fold WbuC family metalloprotein
MKEQFKMLKIVDTALMDSLTASAVESPRKRSHHNFHASLEESIHRLCIAAEPGTYVRPHRHLDCNKWELFIMLRGSVAVIIYDESGRIEKRITLKAGSGTCAVEMSADTWHSFISLEPGTVFIETKPGPYSRPPGNDFAAWAPEEGTPEAVALEAWLHSAANGACWHDN